MITECTYFIEIRRGILSPAQIWQTPDGIPCHRQTGTFAQKAVDHACADFNTKAIKNMVQKHSYSNYLKSDLTFMSFHSHPPTPTNSPPFKPGGGLFQLSLWWRNLLVALLKIFQSTAVQLVAFQSFFFLVWCSNLTQKYIVHWRMGFTHSHLFVCYSSVAK